jgi:hypothetical protein
LLDECAQETLPGSALDFITADTVSARVQLQDWPGMRYDTLFYTHDGEMVLNM